MRISPTLRMYLLLAFSISWSLAGLVYFLKLEHPMVTLLLQGLLFMWGPGVASIVATRFIHRRHVSAIGLTVEGLSWRGLIAAWIAPAGVYAAALGVLFLAGNVAGGEGFGGLIFTTEGVMDRAADIAREAGQPEELARAQMNRPVVVILLLLLGMGLIAGATINLLFALGEELGWRGLMLAELRSWGFWRAQGFIGGVWGLWHAPLILQGHNYPGYSWEGVLMMVAFCVAMSPLMAMFTLRAGSVFAAAAFHGSFNALTGLTVLFVHGANPLLGGVAGLGSILALAVLTGIGAWVFKKEIAAYGQTEEAETSGLAPDSAAP